VKHYTAPTFALLAVSGLLLLGIQKSFSRAGRAANELAVQRGAVNEAMQELAATQMAAKAAAAKGEAADRFLETWQPELSSNVNIEEIFGQLDTLAVNNLLSPSGKNFELKSNYFFNGRQLPVERVNINVGGDYYRTLNWLGAVENAFPLARIEQISFTNNADTLAVTVQFVFPRKFDVL